MYCLSALFFVWSTVFCLLISLKRVSKSVLFFFLFLFGPSFLFFQTHILPMYHYFPYPLSLSISLCLFLSLSLSLSLCLSLCASLCVCLCVCVCLSLSLSVSFYPSPQLSLSPFLSLSLSLYIYIYHFATVGFSCMALESLWTGIFFVNSSLPFHPSFDRNFYNR